MTKETIDKMLKEGKPMSYIIVYAAVSVLYFVSLTYVGAGVVVLVLTVFNGGMDGGIGGSFALGILSCYPLRLLKLRMERTK
ncbi:MAG: hypothetical protein DPW18_13780 [Chloroflexi bacterium]|nr:hypothetical protein [Chloroflexota bacterium]MDL1944461.1 hypothetical protein [Chloroflexi bacterium CFX2]